MNRLPSSIRYWQRYALRYRDGDRCAVCSASGGEKKLEVDHIDGNRSNNYPDNIRLLCHSCNVAEWRRLRDVLERSGNDMGEGEKSGGDATRMVRGVVDYQQGSTEMQANEWYEPHYRSWLSAYLCVHGWILKNQAIAAGAEEVGCSIQAARRYLEKMTSFKGSCYEYKNPMTKQREIRPRRDYAAFAEDAASLAPQGENMSPLKGSSGA